MTAEIQIALEPGNWNASRITSAGVRRDGKILSSSVTSILAGDLPEPYLSVWSGLVEKFRREGLADGERICTSALATRWTKEDIDPLSGDVTATDYIRLTTTWLWSDGRMTAETDNLDDAQVIGLVTYLLTDTAYVR